LPLLQVTAPLAMDLVKDGTNHFVSSRWRLQQETTVAFHFSHIHWHRMTLKVEAVHASQCPKSITHVSR